MLNYLSGIRITVKHHGYGVSCTAAKPIGTYKFEERAFLVFEECLSVTREEAVMDEVVAVDYVL